MLRGLDAGATTRTDYEPPVVELAGADRFGGTVSLYVHASPSTRTHRRLTAARQRLELLVEAGALADARFVSWPATVGRGEGAAVRSLYRSFVDAAGRPALEPFFERGEQKLSVPELAAAARRDGELTGLYPRSTATGAESVEDAVSRLLDGKDVENLHGD